MFILKGSKSLAPPRRTALAAGPHGKAAYHTTHRPSARAFDPHGNANVESVRKHAKR